MGRKSNTFRRGAAAIVIAVGLMAVSGTGANAASGLPDILNGMADSQALKLQLTLPSSDSLNNALAELGLPGTVLPGGLLGQTITQTISLNHGEVLKNVRNSIADHASGFAAPLQGLLGGSDKVATRCDAPGCNVAKATNGVTINLLEGVLPGLGTIKVAGGDSITRSLVNTRNASRLAEVNLSLAPLFDIEALAPVGDALNTLRDTVNETVLPAVNPVLEQVGGTIADLLKDTPLENAVTVGPVKAIPDFTNVDLLDLSILKSFANVRPFTPTSGAGDGVAGLLATSQAKVANIDILGTGKNAWAHVGAVGLNTRSFANGVAGAANGEADVQILGADLGGLVGLDIPVDTVRDLTNGEAIAAVIEKLGLPQEAADNLLAINDLLMNVAGITIEAFPVTENVDPKGTFANASAGTLRIRVEPKIPNPAALAEGLTGGAIPTLDDSDYISTGLALQLDLPNASSAVSMGRVLGRNFPPPPRTGVGTPLMGAIVLIGAAIMVRRFALAK